MKIRYIQFTKKSVNNSIQTSRPYIMTLPIEEIKKIETRAGSHTVYLTINDIEVEGSYEQLLTILDNPNIESESSILNFK